MTALTQLLASQGKGKAVDLNTGLEKMEELLGLMDEYLNGRATSPPLNFGREKWDRITTLYSQIEDLIHQFDGVQKIEVQAHRGDQQTIHKDYVAAGWLSGRTMFQSQGRTQLVKVIAKVRSRLSDPGRPEAAPASVDQLLRALRRFRECCQFIQTPPVNERGVQDIVWIMLRAQFERVDREDVLPRFGAKSYRPDFGVPDLRSLVEVKFIGPKTEVAAIQEEILADVPGYLQGSPDYAGVAVVVYDAAHKLRDARKFIEDLRCVPGIVDVIVIPGIG